MGYSIFYSIFLTYWLARQSLTTEVRVPFPGGQNIRKIVSSDIRNFLLKTNQGRDRGPNFAIFVVWSASNVSAEFLARKESISSPNFHEQLADYYSHVFSFIQPDWASGSYVDGLHV